MYLVMSVSCFSRITSRQGGGPTRRRKLHVGDEHNAASIYLPLRVCPMVDNSHHSVHSAALVARFPDQHLISDPSFSDHSNQIHPTCSYLRFSRFDLLVPNLGFPKVIPQITDPSHESHEAGGSNTSVKPAPHPILSTMTTRS